MILFRIFIFLYGLLTVIAVGEEVKVEQFNWSHPIYILLSLCLMIFAVKTDPEWLLYFGLIALIIFAVFRGVTTNSFHWIHLIVRLITSITLIIVWNWLK